MTPIEQATEAILSTYGDPKRVAADFKIPNSDIQEALLKAEPGTGHHYALCLLAEANPPKPAKAKS